MPALCLDPTKYRDQATTGTSSKNSHKSPKHKQATIGTRSRSLVLVVRYQVSGIRCQGPGARCQVSGARCQVLGVKRQVPGVMC